MPQIADTPVRFPPDIDQFMEWCDLLDFARGFARFTKEGRCPHCLQPTGHWSRHESLLVFWCPCQGPIPATPARAR